MERVREELYLEEQEEANRRREIVSTIYIFIIYILIKASLYYNNQGRKLL